MSNQISNEIRSLARLMAENEMRNLKKQHPNKSEEELLNILNPPQKVVEICSCIFIKGGKGEMINGDIMNPCKMHGVRWSRYRDGLGNEKKTTATLTGVID